MIYQEDVQWMILSMLPQLPLYSEMHMPTYNYYCRDCDSHFSCFQKMSETSLSKCNECGGKIERVITGGTGLIFKGSGFYLTDYKDEKKTDKDTSEKKEGKTEKSTKDNKEIKSSKTEKKSKSNKTGKQDV